MLKTTLIIYWSPEFDFAESQKGRVKCPDHLKLNKCCVGCLPRQCCRINEADVDRQKVFSEFLLPLDKLSIQIHGCYFDISRIRKS